MKILKKWDFWYWYIFIIYFAIGFFHQTSQVDPMGLGPIGDALFTIISIVGVAYIWSIIKVIQICSHKFKNSQIKMNRIVYAVVVVGMIFLLSISVYYIYLMFLN